MGILCTFCSIFFKLKTVLKNKKDSFFFLKSKLLTRARGTCVSLCPRLSPRTHEPARAPSHLLPLPWNARPLPPPPPTCVHLSCWVSAHAVADGPGAVTVQGRLWALRKRLASSLPRPQGDPAPKAPGQPGEPAAGPSQARPPSLRTLTEEGSSGGPSSAPETQARVHPRPGARKPSPPQRNPQGGQGSAQVFVGGQRAPEGRPSSC